MGSPMPHLSLQSHCQVVPRLSPVHPPNKHLLNIYLLCTRALTEH